MTSSISPNSGFILTELVGLYILDCRGRGPSLSANSILMRALSYYSLTDFN